MVVDVAQVAVVDAVVGVVVVVTTDVDVDAEVTVNDVDDDAACDSLRDRRFDSSCAKTTSASKQYCHTAKTRTKTTAATKHETRTRTRKRQTRRNAHDGAACWQRRRAAPATRATRPVSGFDGENASRFARERYRSSMNQKTAREIRIANRQTYGMLLLELGDGVLVPRALPPQLAARFVSFHWQISKCLCVRLFAREKTIRIDRTV